MTTDTPENTHTIQPVTEAEGASLDIVGENINQLKQIFPEAFSEGGVNFDTLRQLLGDMRVLDEGEEKFGLNWHGKKKARQIAVTPSMGTLRPAPEESVDWDTTQNLFIEGDNLEVLKLLQKSYANKVKMIYIDPPYNTGNDFVYADDFKDNLDTYLKYTGQKGDDGLKFSSNTETGGRKHTNWLNMMYPRLKLARNLMRDDGVLYISIDDGELKNLLKLCDEIFGEENFIANLAWKSRPGNDARAKTGVSTDHEYIVCYSKTQNVVFKGVEKDLTKFSNPDNDPRGQWRSADMTGLATIDARPNLHYDLIDPATGINYGCGHMGWAYQKSKMQEKINDGRVLWPKNPTGRPRHKIFVDEMSQYKTFPTIINDINTGHGTRELKELFTDKIFDFPKPYRLLTKLIDQVCDQDNDLVLDLFAGSGTTAHAVMALNAEDGGNRRHISVQLPEITDEKSEAFKAGYKTIAEISKERIRRAAKKIQEENPDYQGDLGFKVFKLDSSNIKPWNPNRDDLEVSLFDNIDNLLAERSEQDILYELLLKRGIDLATPIETRQIAGKNVYAIGLGKIITCLDDHIKRSDVESLADGIIKWQEELAKLLDKGKLETHIFFRDSAFEGNVAKTNMAAILSQNGLTHVRSI